MKNFKDFIMAAFLQIKKYRKTILIVVGCLFLSTVVLLIPSQNKVKTKFSYDERANVTQICELATLKCFYHNVAEYNDRPDGLFQYGLFARYGYKKIWMEYSGIVEIGINADEVQISKPDSNGVVKVYVPDAEVINISADKETLTEPLTETGWITWTTREDETQAFSNAQKNMREEAEQDNRLLARAKNNAKKLIEQYIINMGNELGATYEVQWLEAPLK